MAFSGEYIPSTQPHARAQAEAFEASGGSEQALLEGTEWPIVVLTNVGAKTGGVHKTALMRVEHEGRYAVVASKGGAPKPPAWYWNVKANPRVALQDGSVTREYDAREIDGAEYDEWWARSVAAYPPYEDYTKRTDRRIAVFVLEPVEG
ncbi:nitroreductase family deazaflavin-dependent oxidoreductase [Microbacterium indicum]|uniref:nitroreductase family deazaflavin-dependent oxidoreductase n=1 Tax=Microbacterium indicum TaxID=358100 RepID=UPI0003FF8DF8|nr:nitroreductase family deazaflavin-dependent oxidoreductase [Microbacterium indicum]